MCSSAVAIVLTGCVGNSNDEISQRRFDAISTVTQSFSVILDVDEPEVLAISEPCTDASGNFTDETSSRSGANEVDLGRRAEKSLIDDVIAGFGEPPERNDFEGEVGAGEPARIVDFQLTIDDLDVYASAWVTDSGRIGWSARTLC